MKITEEIKYRLALKAVAAMVVALTFVLPGAAMVVNFGINREIQTSSLDDIQSISAGTSDIFEDMGLPAVDHAIVPTFCPGYGESDWNVNDGSDIDVPPCYVWSEVDSAYLQLYEPDYFSEESHDHLEVLPEQKFERKPVLSVDDLEVIMSTAGINPDWDLIDEGLVPILPEKVEPKIPVFPSDRSNGDGLGSLTCGTIYVDDDRPPEWYDATHVKTIQEGVNNASAGDTIYVYNGTYNESIVVNNVVDLVGESQQNVIVDGGGSGTVVFYITIDNVNVTSFTMRNGDYGIYIHSSSTNINITNCYCYLNKYGIYLSSSSSNSIRNCDLYTNIYGVYLYSSSYNEIIDCDSHGSFHSGIYLSSSSYNNITNCSSYDNEYGIYFYYSPNNILRNNIISNNSFHIECDTIIDFYQDIDTSNTINGKTMYYLVEENDLVIQDFGYLWLVSCTNITAKNSDVNGVLLVDTTNSTVSNVSSHNAINGIYLYYSDYNTIEGNNVSNNNNYGVYLDHSCYNLFSGNIVSSNGNDGIYAGHWKNPTHSYYNTFTNNTISSNNGDGISISCHKGGEKHGGCYVNNTISYNSGSGISYGGAMGGGDAGRFPGTFINNNISSNGMGISFFWLYGGYAGTTVLVENNTISSNNGNGIGLYAVYWCLIIKNNTISSNNGIGISSGGVSHAVNVMNNIIVNNSGGGVSVTNPMFTSYYSIRNNIISSNGEYGIYLNSYLNSVANNIISSNEYGIRLHVTGTGTPSGFIGGNDIYDNTITSNDYGIYVTDCKKNKVYNNYFDNTINAYDTSTTIWNLLKKPGENIIGGSYFGGNYWSDYDGVDTDDDGIGDTQLPYTASGYIPYGGDWLPLVTGGEIDSISSEITDKLNEHFWSIQDDSGFEKVEDASGDSDTEEPYRGVWNNQKTMGRHTLEGVYVEDRTNTKINMSSDDQSEFPLNTFLDTIYVPDDYSTIQAAVENASDDDTIIVRDGTYIENINVNKRLTIESENGSADCIVQASNPGNHVFSMGVDYATIDGFTVKGATDAVGMHLGRINYCDILNNICMENRYGIFVEGGVYEFTHGNNNIINNTCEENGYGLYLYWNTWYNVISGNIINSNNYGGIYLKTGHSWGECGPRYNTFTNNIINSNNGSGICSWSTIQWGHKARYNTFINNIINSNGGNGIEFVRTDHCTLINNTINLNGICAIYLSFESNGNVIANNTCDNNIYGIYVFLFSDDNEIMNNTCVGNEWGVYLYYRVEDNLVYNNYFNNTKSNAWDNSWYDEDNEWYIEKTSGENIVGGPFLGGNYWSDYTGVDVDGDGIGDTMLPYDSLGNIAYGGDWYPLVVVDENDPPSKPTITGETKGKVRIEYEYTFVSIDPNGDDVWYRINWSDDTPEELIGPYPSGQEVTSNHTWDKWGFYTIKAKAKDIHGAESDWGYLKVRMPVDQQVVSSVPDDNAENTASEEIETLVLSRVEQTFFRK